MRILIIMHGMPPIHGHSVSGGGIRAWANGQALAAQGLEVFYATRAEDVPSLDGPGRHLHLVGDEEGAGASDDAALPAIRGGFAVRDGPPGSGGNPLTFTTKADLLRVVEQAAPDVLLLEQFEEAARLEEVDLPMVVDLYAPRIIEAQFQGPSADEEIIRTLDTLNRADFYLFSNQRQKFFYLSLLALCGVDCTRLPAAVVPISGGTPLPPLPRGEEPRLVCGGVFWPWVDLRPSVSATVDFLRRRKVGRLDVFGGRYNIRSGSTSYVSPMEGLTEDQHLQFRGMQPYDQLLAEYGRAHAALDLVVRNPEREMNLSFRQIDYLRAGLPIITAPFQEIADDLLAYQAGWVVEPGDTQALERVLEEICDDPGALTSRGDAARRLAQERYQASDHVDELLAFCARPQRREKRDTVLAAMSKVTTELWADHEELPLLRERMAILGTENSKKTEEVTALNQRIWKLIDSVDRMSSSVEEVTRFRSDAILYLGEEQDRAIKTVGELQRELDRRALDLRKKDGELQQRGEELEALKASLEQLKAAHRNQGTELDERSAAATALEQGRASLEKRLRDADKARAALLHDRDKKQQELEALQTELSELAGVEVPARDRRIQDLQTELDEVRRSLLQARDSLRRSEELVARRREEWGLATARVQELEGSIVPSKDAQLFQQEEELLADRRARIEAERRVTEIRAESQKKSGELRRLSRLHEQTFEELRTATAGRSDAEERAAFFEDQQRSLAGKNQALVNQVSTLKERLEALRVSYDSQLASSQADFLVRVERSESEARAMIVRQSIRVRELATERSQLAEQLERSRARARDLADDARKKGTELAQALENNARFQRAADETNRELLERLDRSLHQSKALQADLDRALATMAQLRTDISHKTVELDTSQARFRAAVQQNDAALHALLEEADERLDMARKEAEEMTIGLSRQLAETERALAAEQRKRAEDLQAVRERELSYRKQSRDHDAQMSQLRREFARAKEEASDEQRTLLAREAGLRAELAERQGQLTTVQVRLADVEADSEKKTAELDAAQSLADKREHARAQLEERVAELDHERRLLRQEVGKKSAELGATQARLASQLKQLDEERQASFQLTEKSLEEVRAEAEGLVGAMRQELARATSQLVDLPGLREEVTRLRLHNEELSAHLDKARDAARVVAEERTIATQEAEKKGRELEEVETGYQAALRQADDKVRRLGLRVEELRGKLGRKDEQVDTLVLAREELERVVAQREATLEVATRREAGITKRYERLLGELSERLDTSVEQAGREAEAVLEGLQAELGTATMQLAQARQDRAESEATLRFELAAMRDELAKRQEEAERLREDRDALRLERDRVERDGFVKAEHLQTQVSQLATRLAGTQGELDNERAEVAKKDRDLAALREETEERLRSQALAEEARTNSAVQRALQEQTLLADELLRRAHSEAERRMEHLVAPLREQRSLLASERDQLLAEQEELRVRTGELAAAQEQLRAEREALARDVAKKTREIQGLLMQRSELQALLEDGSAPSNGAGGSV